MPNELIPMSTWTPKDGQTYEIVDAEARERITDLEDGTVKSVNSIEPDANGNVTLPVPSKTSDLTNDSGFITVSQVPSAPVQSVNSKTGAVVLSASDVGAMPSSYVAPVTSVNGQTGDVVIQAGGGAVDSVNGKTGVVVLDAEDVGALPDDTVIPPTVTEQTVSGWGFTKNTGTYSKPSGGIPKTDLASDVQTSLGKADSALQQHQSLSGYATEAWVCQQGYGTYSKPTGGIPASDMASAVQTSLGKADTALQSHQSLAAYRTSAAQDTIDAGKLGVSENAYRSASIPMGELDSTSTATVMTATVPGITELRDGVCVWLKNGKVTSASGFTVNINNLGAKPCYNSLAAATRATTVFNVNYTMLFVYNSTRVDGGCWDIVYGYDSNTTYTPPKLGFGYGTCTTAAATAAKTASISSYALTAGGIVTIKFENDVPANATLNITNKGAKAIYHRGAAITAGVIKAGDTATFVYSTYYHLISIDRDETGGSSVTVDDDLSSTSENPVQNKVIKAALDTKLNTASLTTELDDNVGAKTHVLTLSGTTVTLNESFTNVVYGLLNSARKTIFALVTSTTGGQPTSYIQVFPIFVDQNTLSIVLSADYNGSRYSVTMSEAYVGAGQMTGTLVVGAMQTQAITDTGGYFTTDTVEGALQEIGAELAGINTLIGSGVIT